MTDVLEHNFITMWLRPRNPVEAAERWKPAQDHTAFILPFLFEGLNRAGIYIDHDSRLPRVFGLVLKVHPTCRRVRVMDVCMFRPHAFDEFYDAAGDTLYAIHEESIRTLLAFLEDGTVKLIPQNGYVAVEPKARAMCTDSGIALPQTMAQHGPQEGTIFATSPEVDESGKYHIGDRILFSAYSGSEVTVAGVEVMLVQSNHIVAILEETEAAVPA